MSELRLIEGETYLYNGLIWIAKGYQHPPGKVIAFPKYSLLNYSKLSINSFYEKLYYWDCLKIEASTLDIDKIYHYTPIVDNSIQSIVKTLSELIGFENYSITGSVLLSKYIENRDLDIVVYGFKREYIETIEKLINKEILKPLNYGDLYSEYMSKHVNRIDFKTYFNIKKNTKLHFFYRDIHVNLRFNKYEKGFNKCIDPVYRREFLQGEIVIIECIDKYVIPSKYIIEYNSREYYLESYRELYAELPLGKYYVNGFLEYRSSGVYIIPDHGYLVYKNT
ncbi:MAG: hypothetical protein QXW87_01015 [Desulfurococcaceae archaeon]